MSFRQQLIRNKKNFLNKQDSKPLDLKFNVLQFLKLSMPRWHADLPNENLAWCFILKPRSPLSLWTQVSTKKRRKRWKNHYMLGFHQIFNPLTPTIRVHNHRMMTFYNISHQSKKILSRIRKYYIMVRRAFQTSSLKLQSHEMKMMIVWVEA